MPGPTCPCLSVRTHRCFLGTWKRKKLSFPAGSDAVVVIFQYVCAVKQQFQLEGHLLLALMFPAPLLVSMSSGRFFPNRLQRRPVW